MKSKNASRLVVSLLCLCLMLSLLSGCGSSHVGSPTTENPGSATETDITDTGTTEDTNESAFLTTEPEYVLSEWFDNDSPYVGIRDSADGRFNCIFYEDYVDIQAYHGNETELVVPAEIEGVPVRKANYVVKDNMTSVTYSEGIRWVNGSSRCDSLQSVVLPSTLEYLAGFIGCPNLTNVDIPVGVKVLDTAFLSCDNLVNANLPEGLTHINGDSFSHCDALESIELPDGLLSIWGFRYSGLTSLVIPDSVVFIDGESARSCNNLAFVHLPADLSYLGRYSFGDCPNLTQLEIPESTMYVGEGVMYNTPWLENWIAGNGGNEYITFSSTTLLRYNGSGDASGVVSVPENFTSIAGGAFADCNISGVVFPDGMIYVGEGAFRRSTLVSAALSDNIVLIGEDLFSDCYSLTDASLPAGINGIPAGTFENCQSLVTVEFPEKITTIGEDAFFGTWNMEAIDENGCLILGDGLLAGYYGSEMDLTLPDGVKSVYGICNGPDANVITSVVVPEGVTHVGRGTFKSMPSLRKMILSSTVQKVEPYAIYDCPALREVRIENPDCACHGNFRNCSNVTVYCKGKNQAYYSINDGMDDVAIVVE